MNMNVVFTVLVIIVFTVECHRFVNRSRSKPSFRRKSSTCFTRLRDLERRLKSLEQLSVGIKTNRENISRLDKQFKQLEELAKTSDKRINELEEDGKVTHDKVDKLNKHAKITKLQLADHWNRIQSLTTSQGTVEGQITSLTTTVDSQGKSIVLIQGDINEITILVDTTQTNITAISIQVQSIAENLQTLSESVQTLTTEQLTIGGNLADLTALIDLACEFTALIRRDGAAALVPSAGTILTFDSIVHSTCPDSVFDLTNLVSPITATWCCQLHLQTAGTPSGRAFIDGTVSGPVMGSAVIDITEDDASIGVCFLASSTETFNVKTFQPSGTTANTRINRLLWTCEMKI